MHKAARLAGFEEVVAKLPEGWNTFLRAGGEGLSVGQRQRLALVRALLSTKQLIALDEPSAHLDAHLVAQVAQVVQQLKDAGKTVVLIAHRKELAQIADQVVRISSVPFTPEETEKYRDTQPQAARASEAEIPEFLGSTRGWNSMKTWFITTEERQALKRAIKLLELKPGTLFLACFLGAAGLGASIALGATAAWLIARASQMPPVLYLEVAVVSVRLFGISKAVFRYLERLASHQLGVSGMTTLRTNLYKTLSHSDTARIASLRRGDILDRLGTDVDNIGDFVVKSLLPAMVATIVGIITVIGISLVDWRAGLFLTLGLLLSGVVGPLFTIRSTRIAQRRETESRAHISEVAMTIVDGSAQITVDGQTQQVLAGLSDLEDQLYDAKDATAKPAAWAAAIDVFGMLMSVIMAAYFGIFAVIDQSIPEVMLAVLALTPLASFEGTAQLGPAAQQLVISATSAVRIMNMLPRKTR